MRIAFVGKGGAGKSTLAAAFALWSSKESKTPVVAFDADINIHLPKLLGFQDPSSAKHLSNSQTAMIIKKWLIGSNPILDIGSFRKTTPPTAMSNLIRVSSLHKSPLWNCAQTQDNLFLFTVGTYQSEEIGASCYHNHLSVFESVLSHFDDHETLLLADMVAGTDAFAGTLHAQFDLNCIVVEATARSVDVCRAYCDLAQKAGEGEKVLVIGNKIKNEQDKQFLRSKITNDRLLGFFEEDPYLRIIEQNDQSMDISKLKQGNQKLLAAIVKITDGLPDGRNERLRKLHQIHKKYVGQAFVKERYGDLTGQIDKDFFFQ